MVFGAAAAAIAVAFFGCCIMDMVCMTHCCYTVVVAVTPLVFLHPGLTNGNGVTYLHPTLALATKEKHQELAHAHVGSIPASTSLGSVASLSRVNRHAAYALPGQHARKSGRAFNPVPPWHLCW
jgi:hypothetical protein